MKLHVRQFLMMIVAVIGISLTIGCHSDKSVNRDSQGNRLPDDPPQHTPPPRQPSN